MSVAHSTRLVGITGINFRLFIMKVCCVFSLESPHQGDSNEKTQYTIFTLQKENHPKLSLNLQTGNIFQGTQERARNSCGKRATSVRAIEVEVLLYLEFLQ